MRTLLERSQCLVTEIEDRKQEDFHVEEALRACRYPKYTFNKVRRQIESKRNKKTRKQRDSLQRPVVVIPYVENFSEAVARIMRKHNVPVAVKPYKTLKTVLVHPKDKQDLTECVYKVPCANCDKTSSAKLEGNLELDYRNTGLKWTPKLVAHSLEAFVHQV